MWRNVDLLDRPNFFPQPSLTQIFFNFFTHHLFSIIIILGFEEDMKGTYCFFVLTLQLACWVSDATRTLAPNHPLLPHKQGLISSSLDSKQDVEEGLIEEEILYRGMRKVGSSAPSCEHKCYGCSPCEAFQVPTNNNNNKGSSHVRVQYTNYEPEGWKCKCGPSFYSP